MAVLLDGFEERVAQFMRAAATYAETLYCPVGDWVASTPPPATRERYWLCFALYRTGKTELADAIVRQGRIDVTHLGNDSKGSTFDIFHSNIAAALLNSHANIVAPDVRATLERLVDEAIAPDGRDRGAEYMFHGYNDNMPAKASMGLILGGEHLGMESAVAHGVWNLKNLRNMLVRRGVNSEYNSPTYSPVTIHALAEIAAHANSAEARELALQCEERLWIDLAARFHPEIGVIAGPHSRAYTADLLASVTCLSSTLWFVLGDIAKPSPMVLFDGSPDRVVHHAGDYPFNVAQMTWFASGTYHIPEQAFDLFHRKPYPFRATATFEQGDGGADYPARADTVTTYLTPDFAVGTAGSGWLNGDQSAPYQVLYKRNATVNSPADYGTVFTKLVVNDEAPGTLSPTACSPNGEEDNLKSHASTVTAQHDATVLVATVSHLALGGPPDAIPFYATPAPIAPLSRLSELVAFPSHFGGADEILVGGKPRAAWSGEVATGDWIACRRGRLLIAILPIAYSKVFGQASVRLERCGKYEVIRSTFYEGDPRDFARAELRLVCGGFVAEHASVDEYPSLAAFAAAMAQGRVTDFVFTTRRSRYVRPATSARPALDLEISWSPASASRRYVAVNGHVADTAPVAIDGVDPRSLPFLGAPVETASNAALPFAPFEAQWGNRAE